jgi:hypothetical protein
MGGELAGAFLALVMVQSSALRCLGDCYGDCYQEGQHTALGHLGSIRPTPPTGRLRPITAVRDPGSTGQSVGSRANTGSSPNLGSLPVSNGMDPSSRLTASGSIYSHSQNELQSVRSIDGFARDVAFRRYRRTYRPGSLRCSPTAAALSARAARAPRRRA